MLARWAQIDDSGKKTKRNEKEMKKKTKQKK